jgi:hypothetical protein
MKQHLSISDPAWTKKTNLNATHIKVFSVCLFFMAVIGGMPHSFAQPLTTAFAETSTIYTTPPDLSEKAFSSDPVISCNESGLQSNDWQGQLSFDQFDPALGILQRVEWRVEGKTVASMEIEGTAIPTGQSQVKLSSQLELQLPGGQTLLLEPVAELKANTRKSQEQFSGVAKHLEIIEKDFQSYLGTGKLVIPATGKGYNSKDKKSPVQLYTKSALSVCITYHYQTRN